MENTGSLDDAYSITLTDLAGAPLITFAAAGTGFVPDEDLVCTGLCNFS